MTWTLLLQIPFFFKYTFIYVHIHTVFVLSKAYTFLCDSWGHNKNSSGFETSHKLHITDCNDSTKCHSVFILTCKIISTGTDPFSADQRWTAKRSWTHQQRDICISRKKERQEDRKRTETVNGHTVWRSIKVYKAD